jgi:hypothetical protein
MADFKYKLDHTAKKFTCPSCSKRTFTKYIYAESGDYVADEFGRCDRENNCAHHRNPMEDSSFKPKPQIKKSLPKPKTVAPSAAFCSEIENNLSSELHAYCRRTLGISNEHLTKWLVGTYYHNTAFGIANATGEKLNIKFVRYTPEGKRDKTPGDTSKYRYFPHYLGKAYLKKENLLLAEQEDKWQDYFHFERCFYGQHLWEPDRDTCIVESEKTAMICAWFFPDYNWLATGGNNGIKFEQFSLFIGYSKTIVNLVDNDQAGFAKSKTIEWLRQIAEVRGEKQTIKSVNILQGMPHGYDIADAVIFKDYRSPAQFADDIRHALDIAIKVDIDYDTGEVLLKERVKVWNEKELKRAKQTVQRICDAKLSLLGDTHICDTVGKALAIFGNQGREMWHLLASLRKDYQHEQMDSAFDSYLLFSDNKDAAKFFELAAKIGVETRLIKTLQPRAAEGAGDIQDEEYAEYYYNLPDGCNLTDKIKNDTKNYNFIEHKNQYYFAKIDFANNRVDYTHISNFVIKPLFLIQSKTDPKRIFEITNVHGQRYVIDVPTKALVSQQEFNVFVESQGNFLMDATKPQFKKIKSKLYDQTRDAEEIKTLGWHRDGFYAFGNGIYNAKFTGVDSYGIINHAIAGEAEDELIQKHYFIPALSSIYKNEEELYDSEKKFIYVDRKDVDFESWARIFYDAYGDNGIWGMCFYISSLFRDMIYNRFKFFPHLHLFGPPGTGKSTMAWSISYMFGIARNPFNLNSGTDVGFHRMFAQFRNAVIWFDEYANTIDFKRVQHLKGAYDGSGHTKGEYNAGGASSNKTINTPVLSSCVISGQELPVADNALFKRVILLQYHQTEFTKAESKRMDELKELQEKGLSHITGQMFQHRELMETSYFSTFEHVYNELSKHLASEHNIETRIVQNAAIIATTYKVLADKMKWPFTWEKLVKVFVEGIKSQNSLIANAKETNQFWDQVDYLLNAGLIKENEDFKIELRKEIKININRNETATKAFEKGEEIIYIRLSKLHPLYLTALRNQGEKKGMDKGSLIHYLSHTKGYVGAVYNTNFKAGDKNAQSSAYCFQYSMLEDMGYNFKRYFDDEPLPELPAKYTPAIADF